MPLPADRGRLLRCRKRRVRLLQPELASIVGNMTETMIATASPDAGRPPYKAAVAVFAVVLTGYVWTLAPSVTFWDAGEFIATSKIRGL